MTRGPRPAPTTATSSISLSVSSPSLSRPVSSHPRKRSLVFLVPWRWHPRLFTRLFLNIPGFVIIASCRCGLMVPHGQDRPKAGWPERRRLLESIRRVIVTMRFPALRAVSHYHFKGILVRVDRTSASREAQIARSRKPTNVIPTSSSWWFFNLYIWAQGRHWIFSLGRPWACYPLPFSHPSPSAPASPHNQPGEPTTHPVPN